MPRFFNTAGLCFPEDHYMVEPLNRFHGVEELISRKLYFTIHAPRQTGKTTYLYALARKLNGQGTYTALVVSFEQAGYAGISVDKANQVLIEEIYSATGRQLPESERPQNPGGKNLSSLKSYLENWSSSQKKPIVLFIDEIDALLDEVLVAMLRQLRDGYQGRPKFFPSSIVLVGLRDVRDYKAEVRKGQQSMGTASPFNIKSDSLILKNFSREEVFLLLEQHTHATGQVFPDEVKEGIYALTGGQPWLTNALANQMVFRVLKNDVSKPITPEVLVEAKNQLILRRDTHLDSLVDKLKEDRVKRIVQAVVNGDNLSFNVLDDDIVYVRDLGIIGQTDPLSFANPIYSEIILRIMASPIQASIPADIRQAWFVDKKGRLDMDKLLKEFQRFYRRNGGAWLERYEYKESAHHLLLMAFLQRVINAGGEIRREMAVGNGRLDLFVGFGNREFALELKIKRGDYTIEDGKEQLHRYIETLGLPGGYLVIFDPADKPWEEKLYFKPLQYEGKQITMVGL